MKKIIHFDTTNNISPSRNPYQECVLPIISPIKHIKSIALKSAELPLVLPTIISTENSQTIPFSITYPKAIYTTGNDTTIPYKIATPIQGFLNSQITSSTQSFGLEMIYPVYPIIIESSVTPVVTVVVEKQTLTQSILSNSLIYTYTYTPKTYEGQNPNFMSMITLTFSSINETDFYELSAFVSILNSASNDLQFSLTVDGYISIVVIAPNESSVDGETIGDDKISFPPENNPNSLLTILGYTGIESQTYTKPTTTKRATISFTFGNKPLQTYFTTKEIKTYNYPINLSKTHYDETDLLNEINDSLSSPDVFSTFIAKFENGKFGFELTASNDVRVASSISKCSITNNNFLQIVGSTDDLQFDGTYLPQYFSNEPIYDKTPFDLQTKKISVFHSISITLTAPYTLSSVVNTIQTQFLNGLDTYTFQKNHYNQNTLTNFSVAFFVDNDTNIVVLQISPSNNIKGLLFSFLLHNSLPANNFLPLLGFTGTEITTITAYNSYLYFENAPQCSFISLSLSENLFFPITSHTFYSVLDLLSYLNSQQNVMEFKIVDNKVTCQYLLNDFDFQASYVIFQNNSDTLKTLGYNGTETNSTALNYPIASKDKINTIINDVITIPLSSGSYGDTTSILNDINAAFSTYLDHLNYVSINPFTTTTYDKTTAGNFSINFFSEGDSTVNVNFYLNPGNTNYMNLFGEVGVNSYTLSFTESPLLKLLGMTSQPISNYSITGVQNLAFPNHYQLSINTYVILYIQNLPISTTTASGLNSTFKIPLSNNSQTLNVSQVIGNQKMNTYFYDEQTQFIQKLQLSEKNFVLDKVKISVYDRTGLLLNALPLDWSFSLEVEFDP